MTKKRYPKNWIKELRMARGMSVYDLADLTGMSGSYITMLENGERRLYWDRIQKIAEAMQCHTLDVTEGPGKAVFARNEREKEVLQIMREMGEREQETFSAGLKAFATARKNDLTAEDTTAEKKTDRKKPSR